MEYFDDVLCLSKIFEEALQRLRLLLEKFKENNLNLKLDKCRFFETSIKYLDYEVSRVWLRLKQLTTSLGSRMCIRCDNLWG